jgi:methionyl-tRNA formyltransferase
MSESWPIVFMGTPKAAAITLEQLLNGPDPIVGVVTQPDRPAGRGQERNVSAVRRTAETHGIPVVAPQKMRDPDFLRTLQRWAPRLIVVVAYGRILPSAILELPPRGCLNVHYSLLPKYRGAAPVAWAIVNGEEKSGVSTMLLVEKMDAGPVLLQKEISLAADETAASLEAKLIPIGSRLLLETIGMLKEGAITPKEQNEAEASYAPILKKEDGRIDWSQPALVLERRVRGLHPWPSAYAHWRGKLLKIYRASVIDDATEEPPGSIVKVDAAGLSVATGHGLLRLEEVQLESRRRMPAADFIQGARLETGESL